MPFTLAHPVAVLPLIKNRRLHPAALIIGSLSPDFLYFLYGHPVAGGHQFVSFLYPNLPLCVLLYAVYRLLWRPVLRDYLPDRLNCRLPPHGHHPIGAVIAFVLAAWIGMATHILLDHFTHPTGYFVQHLPLLRTPIGTLPLFKWLQYGGGVVGMSVCLYYWQRTANRYPQATAASTAEKRCFWVVVAALTLCLYGLWTIWQPQPLRAAAVQVIRATDCLLLALSFCCLCRLIMTKRRNIVD